MEQANRFNHFSIAHQLKRRLRIVVPSLCKDPERTHILVILLLKREGIEQVKVVPAIGSVKIEFNPQLLPADNLLILLDSVLDNLGKKPLATIHALEHKSRHANHPLEDIVFGIAGMSCASCALFLEILLQRQSDVIHVNINYISETARVTSYLSTKELFTIVNDNGYQAFSIDTLSQRKLAFTLEQEHLLSAKSHLKILGFLSLPVSILSLFASQSRSLLWVQAIFATSAIALGGRDIFKKALAQTRQGSANMDSLIALGVGAAYSYSIPALFKPTRHVYFDAATAIIDFVLLGRYLEEVAKNKVVKDIRQLVDLQPQQSTLLKNDIESLINVEDISVGDIILIRPGEKIPVDGIVVNGLSSVNESMVSGSKTPCIKEIGHQVLNGCLNGSGALEIRTTATGRDTVLSGLVRMVDQAQTSKLSIQTTVDRFSAVFVPSVIVLSAATFGGWIWKGETIAHALANSIAVMLISCPCALGLATPAASMVGTGRSARRGIYIRNGEALESAASIDTVIFDKTGTITEGNAIVTELFNISSLEDTLLIQLAASAEFKSEHFLAQAIVRLAKQSDIELLKSSRFYSMPDQGIRATVNKQRVLLGNEQWLRKQNIELSSLQSTAKKLSAQGKTLIYLAIDDKAAGLFALTDPIRKNAEYVINQLHNQNINTLMVTGDTEAAALHIANQVGIEKVIALADPQKKLQIIRDLQHQGFQVAMIGDGINDAPALAAANLSLAIDKGSDIAIESSDLVLLHGDITKVYDAMRISKETLSNIKQNLFWALAYNTVAIPFAVAGKLSPTVASAAMALSSVSVIANSLRINKQ